MQISIFPSKEFYGGSLQDGDSVDRKCSWHEYCCFGPFCFFDIKGVETQPSGSGSWVNEQEVEFIVALYYKLATLYPELRSSSLVAIISPYRYQVKLLREHFRATFGEQSDQAVDINTVDGFQVSTTFLIICASIFGYLYKKSALVNFATFYQFFLFCSVRLDISCMDF